MLRSVFRTLFTPRWLGLTVAVVFVVIACVELSGWQWGRHETKSAANHEITAAQKQPAVPIDRLTRQDRAISADDEFRRVTATGRYDAEHELLVRYRSVGDGGEPGYGVLTPLITESGTAVLVNRGWIPRDSTADLPKAPAAPTEPVEVTGRLRASESGSASEVKPDTGDIRYIDVAKLADWLPYPVYGGYAELTSQEPTAGESPRPFPLPSLDEGPHYSYSIQWLIFAGIAIIGWAVLLVDEATGGRLRERLRRRPNSEDEEDDRRRAAEAAGSAEAGSAAGASGAAGAADATRADEAEHDRTDAVNR